MNGIEEADITLWSKPESFWSEYHTSRPEYPDQLYKIIFDYHARHTKDTDLAIDYGTGLGTAIPALLERFDKVIGVDKNKEQLNMGRKMLHERYNSDRVEMVLSSAEDYKGDRLVSLITAAEAVHWFDFDSWIIEASKHLVKGGTIAFWFYPPRLVIQSASERAHDALHQILDSLGRYNYQKFGTRMKPVASAILTQLDSIELDASVFEDEERHKWQYAEERKELDTPEYQALAGSEPSRVNINAKVVDHAIDESGPFMQQEGWNYARLVKYLDSLGTQIDIKQFLAREDISQHVNILQLELGGADSTFDVAWWLSLVMATKK